MGASNQLVNPRPTSSHSLTLPAELQLEILTLATPLANWDNGCTDRYQALTTFALVSKAWAEWSQTALFSAVQLTTTAKVHSFLQSRKLKDASALHNTKSLVCGSSYDGESMGSCFETSLRLMIAALPGIQEVVAVTSLTSRLHSIGLEECPSNVSRFQLFAPYYAYRTLLSASIGAHLRHLRMPQLRNQTFPLLPNLTGLLAGCSEMAFGMNLEACFPKLIAFATETLYGPEMDQTTKWVQPPHLKLYRTPPSYPGYHCLPITLSVLQVQHFDGGCDVPEGEIVNFLQYLITWLPLASNLQRIELPHLWHVQIAGGILSPSPDVIEWKDPTIFSSMVEDIDKACSKAKVRVVYSKMRSKQYSGTDARSLQEEFWANIERMERDQGF